MSDTLCANCGTDVPLPYGFGAHPTDTTSWYANYYCPGCHRQWRFRVGPDQWSEILRARWYVENVLNTDGPPLKMPWASA